MNGTEMNEIEAKLEAIYHRKFNRTPIDKYVCQDCHTLVGFRNEESKIIKFVDWTTNTVYFRTDLPQPLYLTDPDAHAETYHDRVGLFLIQ